MDNATVCIAVGLRRRDAQFIRRQLHVYVEQQSQWMDLMDYPAATALGAIHDTLNEMLYRALDSAAAYATQEPRSLCGRNDRRPDGVTQIPWRRGRCLA